ncbi:TRAP transporter substrate-binding protein DctP [Ponticoccus gilvus]|nr:TRAP transporter substrate-binding protein DctP [Enemella evansiae]
MTLPPDRLRRFDARLARAETALSAALLGVMLACMAAGAVMRSLGQPLVWADELAVLAMAGAAFFGAAACLAGGGHLSADLLRSRLGWGMAGMRQVVIVAEVTAEGGAAQLAGQRIRTVPLAPEMDFWSGLGAAPTPMPLPALFDAFANGQVDAMQIDHEGTWNAGYWRHAGTLIDSRHMIFPMAAVASARKWQGMADEDRAVVQDIMARQIDGMVALYGEIDATSLASLREARVPVISVGRDWFGPALDAWYVEWCRKAPLLEELEREAAE